MEREGWQMYMADMSYSLVMGMSMGKATIPRWADIVIGKGAEPEKTGAEIFADIIENALNRGE